jgi:hypothetical protein
LSIESLLVDIYNSANINLINIGTSAVSVSIISSTFGGNTKDMYYYGDKKCIQGTITGSLTIKTGTKFYRYINNDGNGGVMNLIINANGKVELSGVTMEGCKGLNGGAIYA